MDYEYAKYLLSAGLEFFFALISLILLVGCLFDRDRKRKSNVIMIIILITHFVMNVADAIVWLWCDIPDLLVLMKVLSFVSYALGSCIFAMFAQLIISYISESKEVQKWVKRIVLGLSIFMIVMFIISIFNGMYYYWDENGICQMGDYFFLSQLFGIAFLVGNLALIFVYRKCIKKEDYFTLLLYNAIPLLGFVLEIYWEITPLYMATTISLLIYYIIIHVGHGKRMAEQEVKLVRQELELTNSRTAIVLTQIQPHFLYNSLTAIAQLCEKNPKEAKQTTLYFSEYLRENMKALDKKEPIPFTKELEHVRHYLKIETIRFGDDLNIVYDIETKDFLIPALTLQPVVENAVKHGVGKKEDGGTITISTRRRSDYYQISVKDNGVGFDTYADELNNSVHIGIRNVKERLRVLVGGIMNIESSVGQGTTVTICIPDDIKTIGIEK